MLKDTIIQNFSPANDALASVRNKAWQQFEKVGFPDKTIEEWRYTSLKSVLKADYLLKSHSTLVDENQLKKHFLGNQDTLKVICVDGVFQSQFTTNIPEGVQIKPLSELLQSDVFQNFFNQTTSPTDGLTALNTALADIGIFIEVEKNKTIDLPIELIYFTQNAEQSLFFQPRNLVVVHENAQVKIIEKHISLTQNDVFTNAVTEIFADNNAFVSYYKVQNDTENTTLIDSTYVSQKDNSTVEHFTFSFGGKLVRNNLHFYQNGEHINSVLNGITLISSEQHVDHQTNIYHQQPNCESHELYKGIFDGQSTGVFNGRVLVKKEAQKTDAYQQNDNILLSDDASVNAKPQLEIFADDVKCSHGCTIGQLDKNALFYMKQRGIPHQAAQGLLLYAFTDEVVQRIKIPVLKDWVTQTIARKLGTDLYFVV